MSDQRYTLEEAIAELKRQTKSKFLEGTGCPVCSQYVKLYPVKIPATAVRDLIRLYKLTEFDIDSYRHINDFGDITSRAFAKLEHWGLIDCEINADTSKRTSGMWKLTEKGIDFVNGKITVPNRAYIYNMQALKFSESQVDVRTALGNKFNYEELMSYIA